MNETTIKSNSDLRSAVALANARINNMCNSNDAEFVCKEFIELKSILNSIFKYKVEQCTHH